MDTAVRFIDALFVVYILCILVKILFSWFDLPHNRFVTPVRRFLDDVTEPYLRIFRQIIPPIGRFDLSPMVGLLVLFLARTIVNSALA